MFNLVEKRRWYFILSALIIIPGLAIMGYSWATTGAPFRLSIDFTGGSLYELTFMSSDISEDDLRLVFEANGDENPIIQSLGQDTATAWVVNAPAGASSDSDANREIISDAFDAANLGGNLAVTYTEGVGYLLSFTNDGITRENVEATFSNALGDGTTLVEQDISRWSIRTSFKNDEEETALLDELETLAPIGQKVIKTVSPTVGTSVTRAAFFAILLGAAVITGFIVIAFRQIPNAFRFGVCAILAMVHDILVMMGVMSLMGIILGWEVDALFLTALLTVVGFSVQDSIVVFDRIRENIPLRLGEPYETIVDRSLWETIHRSLATQLNAFFIMIALLLFGGETVQHFIFILFVGLLSGSYSSLFTAVPLLVSWEKGEIPFVNQGSNLKTAEA